MNDRLLAIYLNDHHAGHVIGKSLARRCLSNNRESALAEYLERFLAELDEDGAVLEDVMRRVSAPRDVVKQVAARAAELVGRLKPNGYVVGYSPLSRVEEIEGLCIGVEGRISLFRTLERLARSDERIRVDFEPLIRRARGQRTRLERFRLAAATEAFGA